MKSWLLSALDGGNERWNTKFPTSADVSFAFPCRKCKPTCWETGMVFAGAGPLISERDTNQWALGGESESPLKAV